VEEDSRETTVSTNGMMSYLARVSFLRHPSFFDHGATANGRSVAVKHDVGIVDLEHGKIFYTLDSRDFPRCQTTKPCYNEETKLLGLTQKMLEVLDGQK
jgi:hypothetical protein